MFRNGSPRCLEIFSESAEPGRAEQVLHAKIAELSSSNKELDLYASTVAHDLQSPLTKIRAHAEWLLGEATDDRARESLRSIMESSNRMRGLIRTLLEYSRDASRAGSHESVRLEEVVREVISDLEVPIRTTGAAIELDPLPSIVASRTQMRQLFQNLLENAIKFRKNGEPPRISITSHATDLSVEITVKDNGVGFDPENAEEIFEPYKQLHDVSDTEGYGIGLALCRRIARDHGGRVIARSWPGHGAAFVLKWPACAVSL